MLRAIARIALIALLPRLTIGLGGRAETRPNLSGTWKQSNERSLPKRTGDVTLQIDHHDPGLTVETTILHGSSPARHAIQQYTVDAKVSVSRGADGDEFHTSVVWSGKSLVFSVEEHEDGRIILSRETWALIQNGDALERRRERNGTGDQAGKQTIIYLRDTPKP
jgi:hypothetical protein